MTVTGHRQSVLARRDPPPPRLEVLLSDAALRRPLRDRVAMAEQLRRLAGTTERRHRSVRVLPLAAGLNAAASRALITDIAKEYE